jgi:predicted nucleic acid-binding protein
MLDTSVAIPFRDGDEHVMERVNALAAMPMISVLTRVELEGGVHRDPEQASIRSARLRLMLEQVEELPFGGEQAVAYGRIVAAVGYSRSKLIDRLIAAQALVAGTPLVTLNPRDFRGISGLQIEDWS